MSEENKIDLSKPGKIIIDLPRLGGYSYELENVAGINISRVIYAIEAIKHDLLAREAEKYDH